MLNLYHTYMAINIEAVDGIMDDGSFRISLN